MASTNTLHHEYRIRHLAGLPSPPLYLQRLLAEINDPVADNSTIAELALLAPSIAAKLLKIANSAYFGHFRQVTSIQQAVTLLGLRHIRMLVIGLSVHQAFIGRIGLGQLESFWQHSLTTASIIKQIGQRGQELPAEELYLAGLLHDIGHLVIALLQPTQPSIDSSESGTYHPDHDEPVHGLNHAKAGSILAESWHFPLELVALIAHHHDEELDNLNRSLVTLQLADRLAHQLTTGDDDPEAIETIEKASSVLGIDNAEIIAIRTDLQKGWQSEETGIQECASI